MLKIVLPLGIALLDPDDEPDLMLGCAIAARPVGGRTRYDEGVLRGAARTSRHRRPRSVECRSRRRPGDEGLRKDDDLRALAVPRPRSVGDAVDGGFTVHQDVARLDRCNA